MNSGHWSGLAFFQFLYLLQFGGRIHHICPTDTFAIFQRFVHQAFVGLDEPACPQVISQSVGEVTGL